MRKVIGNLWDRLARNYINDNFEELYDGVNNISGKITDEVYDEIRNDVKLNWKEPVDTVGDLPDDAETGDTRMVRESDDEDYAPVYRFDGNGWVKIQEINTTAIDELESRVQSELDDKETVDGAQDKADTAENNANDYTDVLRDKIYDDGDDVVKVVESGSNANGEYVRYSDGMQYCWGRPFSQDTTKKSWNIYRSKTRTWTYPKKFSERPFVSVTAESYARWADVGSRPGTEGVSVLQFSGGESDTSYTTNVYAYGRWK